MRCLIQPGQGRMGKVFAVKPWELNEQPPTNQCRGDDKDCRGEGTRTSRDIGCPQEQGEDLRTSRDTRCPGTQNPRTLTEQVVQSGCDGQPRAQTYTILGPYPRIIPRINHTTYPNIPGWARYFDTDPYINMSPPCGAPAPK